MKTFSKLAMALLLTSGICQTTEAGDNVETVTTNDIGTLEKLYRDAGEAALKAKKDRWETFYEKLSTEKNRRFLLQYQPYFAVYTFNDEECYTAETLQQKGETGRVYAKIVSSLEFQHLGPVMKKLKDEMDEVCEEARQQVPEELSQEAIERLYTAANEARINLQDAQRRAAEEAQ